MRRLLPFALLAFSCGRDAVFALGEGPDGDGGVLGNKDAFIPDGPFIADEGPGPDGFVPDNGFPRDDGGPECFRPRDCRMKYGEPGPCPDGESRWACIDGVCSTECIEMNCENDCDCDPFLACIGNVCQPADRRNLCCSNPDCPPGDFCIEPGGGRSMCEGDPDGGVRDTGFPDGGIPDTGTEETPVGEACGDQFQCGPIGFCIGEDQGFPDGYCSQDCSQGGQPCPMGADCRGFGMGNAICLDACASNPECRTGYICVQVGLDPQRVCWPDPGGSMNPNGNVVGGECNGDEDCQSGLQCLNFMGWPGGYCTKQFCDPQTNPCPGGSQCFNFPGFFSLCLDTCPNGGTMSDCRPGYYCLGPTGQPGGCIPN
jgi:hypothetical protein